MSQHQTSDAFRRGQNVALWLITKKLIELKIFNTKAEVRSRIKSVVPWGTANKPCDQSYHVTLAAQVDAPGFPDDTILINLECQSCMGKHNWKFRRVKILVRAHTAARMVAFQMYPDGGVEMVQDTAVAHTILQDLQRQLQPA